MTDIAIHIAKGIAIIIALLVLRALIGAIGRRRPPGSSG
jgi:hypothetical protein